MRFVHSCSRLTLALGLAASAVALTMFAPSARAQAQAPDGELLKVVILSRHGVRSPLVDPKILKTWISPTSSWPAWACNGKDCCPGELTPRGGDLATLMGQYYRRNYGLFAGPGCPAKDELYFWADTDQRTYATGAALLGGLLPAGCKVDAYLNWRDKTKGPPGFGPPPVCKKQNESRDPLFHPVADSGACTLPPTVKQQMQAQVPGLLLSTRAPRVMAQCKLQCCLDLACQGDAWWKACGALPTPAACPLPANDHVTRVEVKGAKAQLAGPARIAGTFAELLLLEYGNRLPDGEFGFGRTRPDEMMEMFRLHTEQFAVEERTLSIAGPQGARLLSRILLALEEKSDGKPNGTAPPKAKFVAFVGHDTNIANIGAMLNLNWLQPPYQKNQTPPAGALVFELRKIGQSNHVRAFYATQSPETMHDYDPKNPGPDPAKYDPLVANLFEMPLAEFGAFVRMARGTVPPGCWN